MDTKKITLYRYSTNMRHYPCVILIAPFKAEDAEDFYFEYTTDKAAVPHAKSKMEKLRHHIFEYSFISTSPDRAVEFKSQITAMINKSINTLEHKINMDTQNRAELQVAAIHFPVAPAEGMKVYEYELSMITSPITITSYDAVIRDGCYWCTVRMPSSSCLSGFQHIELTIGPNLERLTRHHARYKFSSLSPDRVAEFKKQIADMLERSIQDNRDKITRAKERIASIASAIIEPLI